MGPKSQTDRTKDCSPPQKRPEKRTTFLVYSILISNYMSVLLTRKTVESRLQKVEPRCVVSAALFIVGRVGAKNMLRICTFGSYFDK